METEKLLQEIKDAKELVKDSEVYLELCQEYDIEPDYLDQVPVCFADLPVSARTQNGIIYLNNSLIGSDYSHYICHELIHNLQQTQGDGPTKGSTEDSYLDNKHEQESFKNQTKYLSETKGDESAIKYVDQVLDHHDVSGKERKKKYEQLLELAEK